MLLDFPGVSDGKSPAYNAGDLGSIPGLVRSLGEGNGNPLQCSGLEKPWTEAPGGYTPWGHRELDTTEQLNKHHKEGKAYKVF